MDELESRFRRVGPLQAPDQWDEITARKAGHRSSRVPVILAILVAVGALGTISFAIIESDTSAGPTSAINLGDEDSECAYVVHFEGIAYTGVPAGTPARGTTSLGFGSVEACSGDKSETVEVSQLPGIDSQTAIVTADGAILLVNKDLETVPAGLRKYLVPPACDPASEPIELRGQWLGIIGPAETTEVDLRPPYVVVLRVSHSSPNIYQEAEVAVDVPETLGMPLTREDLEESLWRGGEISVTARCRGSKFEATQVEAHSA